MLLLSFVYSYLLMTMILLGWFMGKHFLNVEWKLEILKRSNMLWKVWKDPVNHFSLLIRVVPKVRKRWQRQVLDRHGAQFCLPTHDASVAYWSACCMLLTRSICILTPRCQFTCKGMWWTFPDSQMEITVWWAHLNWNCTKLEVTDSCSWGWWVRLTWRVGLVRGCLA